MIAFPELLVEPACEASIRVPLDPEVYDADRFPFWHVYAVWQIGRPLPDPVAHWDNAYVIAAVPEEKIRHVTFDELKARGCR